MTETDMTETDTIETDTTETDRSHLLDEVSQMQAHLARLTRRVGQLEAQHASEDLPERHPREGAVRNFPPPSSPPQTTPATLAPPYPYPDCPRLRTMFGFIETHYHRPIGLNDIARKFGYSPSYLTHLVRQLSGKTIYQWIIGRRMFQARVLLVQTDRTVCEIARAVGYADTGHFVKHFRQLHDRPPKAWRELQAQTQNAMQK